MKNNTVAVLFNGFFERRQIVWLVLCALAYFCVQTLPHTKARGNFIVDVTQKHKRRSTWFIQHYATFL